jgi:hypothetical protein
MADRFSGVPRGKALPGARKIAAHIWEDEAQWRSVYLLDRAKYGIIELSGRLTGFAGWIDYALAAEAQASKSRRRRSSATAGEAVTS